MSPRITAAFIVITMLPVGLLISQLDLMLRPKKWLLPAMAILVAIAFISAGKITSHFDRFSRIKDSLFYGINGNTGRAVWASLDARPDEWTSQVISGSSQRVSTQDFAGINLSALSVDAPALPVPAPDIKVISDTTADGIRSLNLRITSARQAPSLVVYLNPEAKVRAFVLGGVRYDEYPRDHWGMRYSALPPEGVELTLELEQAQNLVVRVTDYSFGLPELPGTSIKPRPDYLMPSNELFNGGFVVTKAFAF